MADIRSNMIVPFENGKYTMTSGFGQRNLNGNPDDHKGYDLVGVGTNIVTSVCKGTVVDSEIRKQKPGDDTWQWGNYVKVRRDDGISVYYCHLAERSVQKGQQVDVGTRIGIMGSTGYSFGAHLHLEVRDANGVSISPQGITGIPNINKNGANASYFSQKVGTEETKLSPYVTTSNYKENFNRRYLCRCSNGKKVIQFGDEINENGEEAEHLHISFSFTKVATEAGNSGKLNVWNLSPEKREVFETEGAALELYAGYGDRFARVISGNVYWASTKMDKADRKTQIEIVENYDYKRQIARTYEGETSWLTIVERAAQDLGLPLEITEGARRLLKAKTVPNYSIIDNPITAIDDAISSIYVDTKGIIKLVRSVQEGVLYITMYGEPVSQMYVEISARTGLIEIPEKELLSGVKYSDDTPVYLWKVKCFLNTAIAAGSMVYVDSSTIKGFYKVHQIEYNGDNTTGDWITTLSLLTITDAAYVTEYKQ